jgi:8-oxo-dGTP pyrophosphatase MutT (NUDIX family)
MRIEAAVLVPIYRLPDDDLMLVAVRRSDWGIHGGQIAFPGGKRETADASLWETALREAREEIGLQAESVGHVADLPVEETLTTEFRVTPFLVRIDPPARWVIDTREISEVLEVRLSELTRPEAHGEEYKSWPAWSKPMRVPFYRIGPHQLWGASYRILEPLIRRLSSGEIAI